MRFLTILLTCFVVVAGAQNKPGTELPIRKAQGATTVRGKRADPHSQRAAVAKDFYLSCPVDATFAPFQPEARLTFDEHNFYVSFVCYDDHTPDIVQSLRRDFNYDNNDHVGFTLGP